MPTNNIIYKTQAPRKRRSKKKGRGKSNAPQKRVTLAQALPLAKSMSTQKQSKPKTLPFTVEQICGLTDPFCDHAVGAKYPDASSGKSLPVRSHYSYFITIGATSSTNNSTLIVPGYINGQALGTGSPSTYGPNFSANVTPTAVVSGYRVVTAGIRLRCVAAPLNASGLVQIRGFANTTGTNLNTVDNNLYNSDFSQDIPLQALNQNGYTDVIFRRTDEVASRQFISPTTTNPTPAVTNWVSNGWGAISVTVVGAPSLIQVVHVEVFFNYEIILDDNDGLALAMTKAPKSSPALQLASSWVSDTAGQIFHEVGKDASAVVKTLAQAAFRKAAVQLGEAVLPMLV